jgi:hypothetical protein
VRRDRDDRAERCDMREEGEDGVEDEEENEDEPSTTGCGGSEVSSTFLAVFCSLSDMRFISSAPFSFSAQMRRRPACRVSGLLSVAKDALSFDRDDVWERASPPTPCVSTMYESTCAHLARIAGFLLFSAVCAMETYSFVQPVAIGCISQSVSQSVSQSGLAGAF